MAAHKILVADEDAELLANIALHLRNEEYSVVSTSEGLEALKAAQRETPDVMLIDIDLAVDDYGTLHNELLEHPSLMHIPIIYLISERTVRLGGVPKLPAQSMVFKPVATRELFKKIELALSGAFNGRPSLGMSVDRDVDFGHDPVGDIHAA